MNTSIFFFLKVVILAKIPRSDSQSVDGPSFSAGLAEQSGFLSFELGVCNNALFL